MTNGAIGDFFTSLSLQIPPVLTPSGWLEHAPFAAWLIDATRPNLVVELGTHWGYSFFAFCEAVKNLELATRCVAIDTWEGDEHAGFYGGNVHDFVATKASADYAGIATLLQMRFDEALGTFENSSIDLLHIDGRHRYEDAAEDFESYLSKVSARGVIVMHDIAVRERGFGVWRHWEDVKRRYPTFEFTHGNGLGVAAVGPDVPPAIQALTSLPEISLEAESVRTLYHRLGAVWTERESRMRAEESVATLSAESANLQERVIAIARQALGRERSLLGELRQCQSQLTKARQLTPTLLKGLVRGRLRAEGVRLLRSDVPSDLTTRQLADLFDAEYYADRHPELEVGQATFTHYLEYGWPVGESPTPLFDKEWYLAVNSDVAASGLSALGHYLAYGDLEGRDPNAAFDSSWYRARHPEMFAPGDLALVKFASTGDRLGHDPSPAFLTEWYRGQYPEVAASGRIALSDYLHHGALMGRDPHPDFDTSWYVARYPDICSDGGNPLVHYLTFGLDEGRESNSAHAQLCRT